MARSCKPQICVYLDSLGCTVLNSICTRQKVRIVDLKSYSTSTSYASNRASDQTPQWPMKISNLSSSTPVARYLVQAHEIQTWIWGVQRGRAVQRMNRTDASFPVLRETHCISDQCFHDCHVSEDAHCSARSEITC